jgi:hypothetical protein
MNTLKITTLNAFEHDVHRWTAEASDVGLTAARIGAEGWPASIQTDLGNGLPFIAVGPPDLTPSGDLAGVRYRQANGCISLLLIND